MSEKAKISGGVRPTPKVKRFNKRNARILIGVSVVALFAAFYFDPITWLVGDRTAQQTRKEVDPPAARINVASLPTDYSDQQRAGATTVQGGAAPPPPEMVLDLPPPPNQGNQLPPPERAGADGGRTMKATTSRAPLGFVGEDPLSSVSASAQIQTDPAAQYAQMAQLAQAAQGGGQTGGQGGRKSKADEFRQSNRNGNSMFLGSEPVLFNTRPGWGVIPQGTIIPAKLTTATNSELGGNVTARVSADIYDHGTGSCLMIGRDNSTLFGKLSDQITYGQNMHQAIWTSLITPKMQMDLKGMDAVDGAGRTGIDSNVNRHYGRLAAAVIGATVIDIIGDIGSRGRRGNTEINIGGTAADNAASVGQRLVQRELDVQDTLEQIIGHPVNLMVNQTIELPCLNRS